MEGFFLYNQAEQLMEQYPLTVTETAKGRGALICITECGEKILKEYKGSAVRAEILHDVAEYLNKAGIKTDGIIKTTEGAFLSGSAEEGFYLLKDWYSGRECDTKSRDDILEAVAQLARMHQCLAQYDGQIPEGFFVSEQILIGEYERHTRELKKVRNYIRAKKKKNLFETKFMEHYSGYLTQAEEVEERLKEQAAHREESEWQQMYGLCHGDYNQHNILFRKEGIRIINLEQLHVDVQVSDLALFML